MARSFVDRGGDDALRDVIGSIERASSAEVVVAVRGSSGSFLHADLAVGAAAAVAALAFLLFSPYSFALPWLLVDPLWVGALAALATWRLPTLRRRLTPEAVRRRRVRAAARATFVDKRVHDTTGRTGILVYVSVLERMAELVADVGIERAVAAENWERAGTLVDDAVARGGGGRELAAALAPLCSLLGAVLPCAPDDVNELSDEVSVR